MREDSLTQGRTDACSTPEHPVASALKMSSCAWPRGCFEPVCGCGGPLCYYHTKVRDGFITADWYLMEVTSGKPHGSRRSHLARTLGQAGASEQVVELAKVIPMHPRHFSRHGTGYIRQGILHVRV